MAQPHLSTVLVLPQWLWAHLGFSPQADGVLQIIVQREESFAHPEQQTQAAPVIFP